MRLGREDIGVASLILAGAVSGIAGGVSTVEVVGYAIEVESGPDQAREPNMQQLIFMGSKAILLWG
jgi:hypothetical protein